jgi:uncharacterized membrane protein
MSTLVVLAFPTESGAEDVLTVIEDLQRQQLITLDDAATVVRDRHGKPQVKQAKSLVGEGAWGGAFWGLLFGFLFFVPFLGLAIGAAAGALMAKFTDVGIDDQFIREVQEKIKAGQSGLFLLVRDVKLDRVLPAVEPYHPEVLQTSLSTEQEARLREALGGAPAETVVAASAVVESATNVPKSEDVASDESGFRYLFDNTAGAAESWQFVGGGSFAVRQRVFPRPGGKSLCELDSNVVSNAALLHCRDERIAGHYDRVHRTSGLNGRRTCVTCQQPKLARRFALAQRADDALVPILRAHEDVSATYLNDVQRIRDIALLHQDRTIIKVL